MAVRDRRAAYGERRGPEAFPAEPVLRDLRTLARDDDPVPVLARYATLRYWLLRADERSSALVSHARLAAREHLAATPHDWEEGALLERVVARPEPLETATALLTAAAERAEASGHLHGAAALRHGAYVVAVRRLHLRRAGELARGLAEFLRRRGDDPQARGWEARARRLEELAPGASPPSPG